MIPAPGVFCQQGPEGDIGGANLAVMAQCFSIQAAEGEKKQAGSGKSQTGTQRFLRLRSRQRISLQSHSEGVFLHGASMAALSSIHRAGADREAG